LFALHRAEVFDGAVESMHEQLSGSRVGRQGSKMSHGVI